MSATSTTTEGRLIDTPTLIRWAEDSMARGNVAPSVSEVRDIDAASPHFCAAVGEFRDGQRQLVVFVNVTLTPPAFEGGPRIMAPGRHTIPLVVTAEQWASAEPWFASAEWQAEAQRITEAFTERLLAGVAAELERRGLRRKGTCP